MMRPARLEDLVAVQSVTEAAYEPYRALLGGPPLPVTEDYAPRILRSEVWLRERDDVVTAIAVFERHADHLLIFSICRCASLSGSGAGH